MTMIIKYAYWEYYTSHQKEALDFMIQRETGDDGDRFRLWKEINDQGSKRYGLIQHRVSSWHL